MHPKSTIHIIRKVRSDSLRNKRWWIKELLLDCFFCMEKLQPSHELNILSKLDPMQPIYGLQKLLSNVLVCTWLLELDFLWISGICIFGENGMHFFTRYTSMQEPARIHRRRIHVSEVHRSYYPKIRKVTVYITKMVNKKTFAKLYFLYGKIQ